MLRSSLTTEAQSSQREIFFIQSGLPAEGFGPQAGGDDSPEDLRVYGR